MKSKDYIFIIGAPKCGTTSLADFLGSQPRATLARRKETMFFTDFANYSWSGPGAHFSKDIISDEALFDMEFSDSPDVQTRVEASTDHMWCPGTAERIQNFSRRPDVGRVRVIAILRDPVSRIVSEYEHTLRFGWESLSLMEALRLEERRKEKGWHPLFYHITRTRYFSQLSDFRKRFGEDLLILDYSALSEPETLRRICEFSGLSVREEGLKLEQRNQRYVAPNPFLRKVMGEGLLTSVARSIVPKRLRGPVRQSLMPKSLDRYVPSKMEQKFIGRALADEIRACQEDPALPSQNWKFAVHPG